jgi:hypothetical protein
MTQVLPKEQKYSPYLESFKLVQWKVIGSVDWNDEKHLEASRLRNSKDVSYHARRVADAQAFRMQDFGILMYQTRRAFDIKLRHFHYFSALEFGVGGGAHLHFCIAKDGLEGVCPLYLSAQMRVLWNAVLRPFDSDLQGIGRAWVEPYDTTRGRGGLEYSLKLERDGFGGFRDKIVEPSDALIKLIRRKQCAVECGIILN